jgi:wyosine [tRNA(Phe)-imidazoG37] synthetase (radical SAM superfamily)
MRPERWVYGPVPSRRLGRSLGVSPVPHKACTYDCVYCQLGRTTMLSVERRRYLPPGTLLGEVGEALDREEVDHVTIVGDGEPTLSLDLGLLIGRIKARWDAPVAVITNGALLHDPEVRHELAGADVVLPSLDAPDEALWRRINRPHPDLSYDRVLEGLREFSAGFGGVLRLEFMLVWGLNDSEGALEGLRAAIGSIGPDRVDLMVPTRPPSEAWAGPPESGRVLRAMRVLGAEGPSMALTDATFGTGGHASAEEAVLAVGSRHPLREREARAIERGMGGEGAVDRMLADGRLARVVHLDEAYVLPMRLRRTSDGDDGHVG